MKVLVTGGGGFLGRAIVEELLARGHAAGSASRKPYPELEALGVQSHVADLSDADSVEAVVAGYDAICHVAAMTGIWGQREDFFRTNVDGTRNVLTAALRAGITRLVYTSSPSVCFDGQSHVNAGNDVPYAERFLCAYPETKAIAERLALEANGRGGLATCALRPHLIFGPRDPHLVPRLVERARQRKLARVGAGTNEVSLTYVDNAAAAHVDALERLTPDAPHAGRAYFIGQEEPVKLWNWIETLLERVSAPPIERTLSRRVAYAIGATCELAWNVLPLAGEPPMTRFVALQLATSHSYDLEPAQRDFGYRERVDLDTGTERVVRWVLDPQERRAEPVAAPRD